MLATSAAGSFCKKNLTLLFFLISAAAEAVPSHTKGILAQDKLEQKVPLKRRLGPKMMAVPSATTSAKAAPSTTTTMIKITKPAGKTAKGWWKII